MHNQLKNNTDSRQPCCTAEIPTYKSGRHIGRIISVTMNDDINSVIEGTPSYIICRPPEMAENVEKVERLLCILPFFGSLVVFIYTQICDWRLRQKKYNPSGYTYQGRRLYRRDRHPHYLEHVDLLTKEIHTTLYHSADADRKF